MAPIQTIVNTSRFVTELVFFLRSRGTADLARRVNSLSRFNLLTLFPNGGNKSDEDLRELLTATVVTRLNNLNAFQEQVDTYFHQDDLNEINEEQYGMAEGILGSDMPGSKFHGGYKMGRKKLRELARTSFRDQKRVIAKELKEWDRDIKARNKEGLG